MSMRHLFFSIGDLPYTVSYKPSAKEISLKVVAQDQFGNKAIDVIYDSNILQYFIRDNSLRWTL